MRLIKFKVWDTKQNKFLEQVPVIESWIDSDSWDDPEQALEEPYEWTIAPTYNGRLIWLQFTGKYDKNGNEIYDGDILYVEFEKSRLLNAFDIYLKKWKHVVSWASDKQGWNIPDIEQVFRETLATAVYNQDKPTPQWEKIGNIYQNPELVDL